VNLPQELGACEVTAMFTNGAGLISFVTTTIHVISTLPTASGEVKGVVLEGSRPQAGLEVTLEKAPNAIVAKTRTNEQGVFVFAGVAPGDYVVKSLKRDAERKGQAAAKVPAGGVAEVTIKLAL
jgi:hypothetical protein